MAKRHKHVGGRPGVSPAPGVTKKPRVRHPVPDVTAQPDRFEEAIHAFERRMPVSREEWAAMKEDERRFAFTVAAAADADMVTELWKMIDSSLRDGTGWEDFKATAGERLRDAWVGDEAPRLDTIFRTNVMTAYNAGREAVFTAPAVKEARPFSRFDAIDDDRTCDECEALNGTTLPIDDPFWDGNSPPIHFNDRCVKTGVSQAEADDAGGPDEAPQGDYADPGFGSRPDVTGTDWEPDFSRYPEPIGEALRLKLDM